MNKHKGFSLIELTIIIIMLVLLGTSIISRFVSLAEKAKESTEEFTVAGVREGINLYYSESVFLDRTPPYPPALDSATTGPASGSNPFFSVIMQQPVTSGSLWAKLASGNYLGATGSVYSYDPFTGVFELLGQLLLDDDFADGDASDWDVSNGTWSAAGNDYQDTSSGMAASFNGQSSWADYSFNSQLQLTSGNRAGMYFRMTDTSTQNWKKRGYMFIYAKNYGPNGGFFIRRLQAGSDPIIVSSAAPVGFDWNTAHNIRIDANGSNLSVSVDGTEYLNVDDSTYATGKIGVKANNNSNANFDNIEIIQD